MSELDAISVTRKTGEELFHLDGSVLPLSLQDFWSWANSDLLNNILRGVLAEFLVASALGIADGVRVEWDAKDLVTRSGVKIEVKSAAYIQSWKQKQYSPIIFDIAPKQGWDAERNVSFSKQGRNADIYIFCLLAEKDQSKVDPLNVASWKFYILSSATLDRELDKQKTLRLSVLEKLAPEVANYECMREAVEKVLAG